MKSALFTPLLLVLASGPGRAQFPEPAAELARFDVALGSWSGHGTASPDPEGSPSRWKSRVTISKIFGGHFVQEDVLVELENLPAPMVFRTVYGWDAERKCTTAFGVGNNDAPMDLEVFWQGDTLIGSGARLENGAVVVSMWTYEFSKDAMEFRVQVSRGGGPFAPMAEGRYTRTEEAFDAAGASADKAFAPPPGEMKKMARENGEWRFSGRILPEPELDWMKISGKERIRSILGGHVQLTAIAGDPIGNPPLVYNAQILLGWDPLRSCYLACEFSSFGGRTLYEARRLDDHRVSWTSREVMGGEARQTRTLVTSSRDFDVLEAASTTLFAEGKPMLTFEGRFERER